MHRDKIPTRWLEELRGMAEGLTAAGIPTTTDDMIAWNDWMEITGYWLSLIHIFAAPFAGALAA